MTPPNHFHVSSPQECVGGSVGRKRTIQSIDLESKLADSLSSQKAKIEEKFLRGKKTSASKTSRERILELASMGEVGVAKSLIMQEISEDLENEKFDRNYGTIGNVLVIGFGNLLLV